MNTDLLIIGGGLSGLMAADACLRESPDTDIIILAPGSGNSPFVHGFNMPLFPEDSVEVFEQDVIKSGRGQCDQRLVRALCSDSLELMPFFEQEGIMFNKNADGTIQLLRPLGASYPRVVSIGNAAGSVILASLRKRLGASGKVRVLNGLRAMKLLQDKSGTVNGALCFQESDRTWTHVFSDAVIMASGGYSPIYPVSTNARDISGDSVAMLYEAGAELTDLEFVQFEPSVAVWPDKLIGRSVITTLFYEGAVLRNASGERFMLRYGEAAEQVDKDVMSRCMAREILDGRGTEHGGVLFDTTAVNAETLKTVYRDYYIRYQNVGIDISKESMEVAPGPHTTLGGAYCTEKCTVNLAGLFVCGEVMGGLHGANRIGGNAGLETMVFGRIAGKSAAEFLKGQGVHEHSARDDSIRDQDIHGDTDIDEIRKQVQECVQNAVGVIRSGEIMKDAVTYLRACCSELEQDQSSYAAMRLYHDTLTALLTVLSANERKGSVGCHFREDGIEEKEKYRIVLSKGEDFMPVLQRIPL